MADIGTGVILLTVLWLIALLSALIFCAGNGSAKYVPLIPIFLAASLTLILGLIPRESKQAQPIDDTVYAYTSLIWILILTGVCVAFVICLALYFIVDIIEPRYAKGGKIISLSIN